MTRLEEWARRLDDSRRAPLLIFWLSMLETVALPIAFEVLLGPHMLRHPRRAWWAATWATAGSVLGALVVYLAGMAAWGSIGVWLVTAFGYEEQMLVTWRLFREYGFWAIVLIGVTPIPYHIALLLAGAAHYPVPLLLVAATLARGTRYYMLAWLVRRFGDAALNLWRRRRGFAVVLIVFVALGLTGSTLWLADEVQENAEEAAEASPNA